MKGFRQPGLRKQKLIQKLFKNIEKAGKNRVNVNYLLKNYLNVTDFRKIKTKEISGLISECKQFLKTSGIK